MALGVNQRLGQGVLGVVEGDYDLHELLSILGLPKGPLGVDIGVLLVVQKSP